MINSIQFRMQNGNLILQKNSPLLFKNIYKFSSLAEKILSNRQSNIFCCNFWSIFASIWIWILPSDWRNWWQCVKCLPVPVTRQIYLQKTQRQVFSLYCWMLSTPGCCQSRPEQSFKKPYFLRLSQCIGLTWEAEIGYQDKPLSSSNQAASRNCPCSHTKLGISLGSSLYRDL